MSNTSFLIPTSQGLYGSSVVLNNFDTYEEAEKFAHSLKFDVLIYKSIARVSIKHEVKVIEGGDA